MNNNESEELTHMTKIMYSHNTLVSLIFVLHFSAHIEVRRVVMNNIAPAIAENDDETGIKPALNKKRRKCDLQCAANNHPAQKCLQFLSSV